MTGKATTSQLPEIAIIGLEEGLDSPSLRILAGLNQNENPFQVEDYFSKTLQELNIQLPDKRQATIEFAVAIAEQTIAGKIDLILGTKQMIETIHTYDFFSDSKNYCYDSIGFENVYGVYYNYDDLVNADHPWQVNKTNDELIVEVKVELLEALRKWYAMIKNGA